MLDASKNASPLARVVLVLAAAALATTAACSREQPRADRPRLRPEDPIPAECPRDTQLRIGDPKVQKQLELSGLMSQLPFTVQWQNITGGPLTLEAFRAKALDAGAVGDTPPIHAKFTGLDIKIVAVHFRDQPTFKLALAPGAKVDSIADFPGKRIAYAPGQAQGALLLRVLEQHAIKLDQVNLIELSGSEFKDALASNQVDIAPLSGPNLRRYLKEQQAAGAHAIPHGTQDSLSFLYVRTAVLEDPAKAAALRAYVQLRGRAQLWASNNSEAWRKFYYVGDQSLSEDDARAALEADLSPRHPRDWREAIALTQETINLVSRASGRKPFEAREIFDLRYQEPAADIASASTPPKAAMYAGIE
jgi:sulfonate transport system substrate-binding protein